MNSNLHSVFWKFEINSFLPLLKLHCRIWIIPIKGLIPLISDPKVGFEVHYITGIPQIHV